MFGQNNVSHFVISLDELKASFEFQAKVPIKHRNSKEAQSSRKLVTANNELIDIALCSFLLNL